MSRALQIFRGLFKRYRKRGAQQGRAGVRREQIFLRLLGIGHGRISLAKSESVCHVHLT